MVFYIEFLVGYEFVESSIGILERVIKDIFFFFDIGNKIFYVFSV